MMAKILIVDDEAAITVPLQGFIGRRLEGHEVLVATKALEAYKILEEQKIDIILLDLNLNEQLTGYDVQKKALSINPKTHTIVITGNRRSDVQTQCDDVGVKLIIEKPLIIANVLEEVKKVISQLNEKEKS